jgi:DNA modification methylase
MTEKITKLDRRNKLNDLTAKEWIQETKSYFYQKGLGNNHKEAKYEKLHPAPFSFTDVSKLLKFFTKKNAKVLDPFVGVGSTLKACCEMNREGFGVELNEIWHEITKQRLLEECNWQVDEEHLICGDSRLLSEYFPKDYFDFIITSPPYWNILQKRDHKANERVVNGFATQYSNGNHADLGNTKDYVEFLDELTNIFMQCYDVLKKDKYMCIVVSDFRHKSSFVPYHSDLTYRLTGSTGENKFKLQGIKILIQNAKKLYPYGYPFSYVENIHHQYILVFKK